MSGFFIHPGGCLDTTTKRLIATAAVVAPALHTVTDAMEWLQGGFSPVQLWLNYLAFLPLPAVVLGLYAAQRPRISHAGLLGAIGYGCAFIYFTHTTLLALALGTPTYEDLWAHLGLTYTAHGGLMILGGGAFGWATLEANVFPRWTALLFLAGLTINLLLALLPAPDLLQTIGTTVRNAGLVGMGTACWSAQTDRRC
jgi:hypothetical protein